MLPKECVDFATSNPIAYVATTDGDQPHVRAVLLFKTDDTGFYIPTLSPKHFARQLAANPRIELCFYNSPTEINDARMMRATGTAEQVVDPEMLADVREQRQVVKQIAGDRWKDEYQILWKLSRGKVVFWTLSDVLKEPDMKWTEF